MRIRTGKAGKEGEEWLGGEERTVAFVDILGFSAKVQEVARRPASFRKIVIALLGSSAVVPADVGDDLPSLLASQEGEKRYGVDLQAAFFSDSTYISARNVEGGADRVVNVVLGYARHLLKREFFVRGGIARGLAAHRGGTVVGPAVLTAYFMEQKAAVYPRIVLQDEVAESLLKIAKGPNATATVRRGEDGLYFLDVLTTLGLREDGEAMLRQARKLIVEHLEDRRSLDLHAKWRWLAAQYNRALRSVGGKGRQTPSPIERPDVAELPDAL
ncbi:MAG: hypothetical protein ACJ76N_22800 [Thermoanaerobaculia bacterium]